MDNSYLVTLLFAAPFLLLVVCQVKQVRSYNNVSQSVSQSRKDLHFKLFVPSHSSACLALYCRYGTSDITVLVIELVLYCDLS